VKRRLQRRHCLCTTISMPFLCTKISMTLVYYAAVPYSGRRRASNGADATGKASQGGGRRTEACRESGTPWQASERAWTPSRSRARAQESWSAIEPM